MGSIDQMCRPLALAHPSEGAVLVVEMSLHARDWLAEAIEALACYGFDLLHECCIASGVGVEENSNFNRSFP